MVLEAYDPSPEELEILAEGFARQYNLRDSDIASPAQVMAALYTQVAASDLIEHGQRTKIFERTKSIIARIETRDSADEDLTPAIVLSRLTHLVPTLGGALVALWSLVGTIIAIFPKLHDLLSQPSMVSGKRELYGAVVAFASSLLLMLAITSYTYLLRRKELPGREESDPRRRSFEFEKKVLGTLRRYGVVTNRGPSDRGFDASININGQPVLIEIKYWQGLLPRVIQQQMLERLNRAMAGKGASEGWIVVNDLPSRRIALPETSRISFLTIDQLEERLGAVKQ